MTTFDIRRLEGEALLNAIYRLGTYAFSATPPLPNEEEWKDARRKRQGVTYFAAFENDAPVSGGASTAMTQNVRGAIYPAGGVWGVATDPAARRKGHCKKMLQALLSANREAGQVFSTLYPFRESFYERLGYVSFPLPRIAKLHPSVLTPLLNKDFDGEVDRQLTADCYEEYRQFIFRMQPQVHGMGIFNIGDPSSTQRYPAWAALARFDGVLEGVMLYTLQGDEITHFKLRASRFYTFTSRARYLLLAWIARHVDQADQAEIRLQPGEYPETWLPDLNIKFESPQVGPMGRVLDVAKMGGMACGPGSFTAQVSDPFCQWNEGGWRFESVDGRLTVTPAAQADCALTIQGLTALVYGTHPPQDFRLRGWGEPSPRLQACMQVMFPAMPPHLHENF